MVTGGGGLRQLFATARTRLAASRHLRLSYAWWLCIGLVFTEAFTFGVTGASSRRDLTALLAVLAVAWWVFVSIFLIGGVAMLRTPQGETIDFLGTPNGLSALRAWACLPVFLCAVLPLPGRTGLYLWCISAGSTGMLDYVDGLIARHIGPVTELGKAIDPAMDALFFSLAAVGAFELGILPGWICALILLRYIGPFVGTPIVFAARRRPELVHTRWGRRNTALVGLTSFILMWVRLFDGPVDSVALAVGIPLLVPTTLLHFIALGQRTYHAPIVR